MLYIYIVFFCKAYVFEGEFKELDIYMNKNEHSTSDPKLIDDIIWLLMYQMDNIILVNAFSVYPSSNTRLQVTDRHIAFLAASC